MGKKVNEALVDHGMDWDVGLYPAGYLKDGVWHAVEHRSFTVREDNGKAFEAVANSYEVINNRQGYHFLADLVDNNELEIDRALEFRGGREVAVVTRVPEYITIGEEEFYKFLVWTTRHDGRGSAQAFGTDVCIVCENTLQFAKIGAKFKHTVRHTARASIALQDAREAIRLSFVQTDVLRGLADKLINTKVDKTYYNAALRQITGLDKINREKNPRKHRNAMETRAKIHSIIRDSDYIANYRNTRWGIMQGVTQYVSHEQNFRTEESKFEKLVAGPELNNRALDVLLTG